MQLSFLGLGAIGTPMAAHLARRHSLTVWNRTHERAAAFAEQHRVRLAATPRDAAIGAEAVITCLPTSREVEALLGGADGLQEG
ncbi:MAG TPA: NAD(P)-binding domain-containing protein, partial [Gemmatimonadales bacterium]|nr:NAD(P)-binding domain-containing protein [Gemmatimonadales bacterium]